MTSHSDQLFAVLLPGEGGWLEEVLFTPARRWVEIACEEAGIQVLPEAPASLPEELLLLEGDRPLIEAETLRRALSLHRGDGNSFTAISVGEEIIGCWISREGMGALPEWQAQSSCRGLAELAGQAGLKAGSLPASPEEAMRTGSPLRLLRLNETARRRTAGQLLEEGVELLSLDGVNIAPDCRAGRGTRILPGTILREGSVIGENCVIGPNSLISGSVIGDGSVFNASQCYQTEIGANVTIGPFCHLRPGSRILDGVHIGDFVEVKNSVIGADTHISHLTYVGDSDVGQRVNFGCGVATANFNGVSKARCTIGDDAFIGCNTNLVAPVTVGAGGYTAAGSTITEEVPPQALAIARARQVNKEGYNRKLRK